MPPFRYRSPVRALCLLASLSLLSACASTEPGTSGGYRDDIGRAPNAQTLAGVSAEVLRYYGFDLEAVETDLVQTDWRYTEGGFRDRATVQIRPRGSDLFVGSIRVAVEGQTEGGRWRPAAPSDDLRDQYADMRAAMRQRLERFMTQN